jgi:hypothetical protein
MKDEQAIKISSIVERLAKKVDSLNYQNISFNKNARQKAKDEISELLESTSAEAYRQGQENGVAWAIKIIDDLHIGNEYSDTTDRLFKGLKNTIRDRYKAEAGVDPAPNYPVRVILQAQAIIQAKS